MRYPFLLLTLLLSSLAVAAPPSDRPPDLKPVPTARRVLRCAWCNDQAERPGRVVEYRATQALHDQSHPKAGKPYYLIDQKATAQYARQGQPGFRDAAADVGDQGILILSSVRRLKSAA